MIPELDQRCGFLLTNDSASSIDQSLHSALANQRPFQKAAVRSQFRYQAQIHILIDILTLQALFLELQTGINYHFKLNNHICAISNPKLQT